MSFTISTVDPGEEYESEKEGFSTSAGASSGSHHASSVASSRSSFEQSDLVSDITLANSNILSFLTAADNNNYGNKFVSVPLSESEKNYQIRLISAPSDSQSMYDNTKSEITTMLMMILLVVVIAILLYFVVNSVEKNAETDDLVVYRMTAMSVNQDPLLAQHRYMPVSL